MTTRTTFLSTLALGVSALALAGCQLDSTATLRTSEILSVAQSGTPVPVNATITGDFVTEPWCKDEGTMATEVLSTPDVPLRLVGCAKAGKAAKGEFQLATTLIKTEGGADDATILQNVLEDDTVRLAVFPHGKHKDLLSVGLFVNLPLLEEGKQKLLAMPVFKRGKVGELGYSFTIKIENDLAHPAKFYLSDVSAGGDLPADEAVLTIPPGGSDTVTLAAGTQAKLAANGWVNFMSMKAK